MPWAVWNVRLAQRESVPRSTDMATFETLDGLKEWWDSKEWWCPICGWQPDFDIAFNSEKGNAEWTEDGNGNFTIAVLLEGPKCKKCQIIMEKSRDPKILGNYRVLKV